MNNLFKKVVSGALVAATAFTMLTPATGLFGTTTANAANVNGKVVTYNNGDTSAASVDLTLGIGGSTTYTLNGVSGTVGTAASATLYAKVANENVATASITVGASATATVTVKAQGTLGNTTIDVYAITVDKDKKTSAGASKILTINVTVNNEKTIDGINGEIYLLKSEIGVSASVISKSSDYAGLREVDGSETNSAVYSLYGEASDGSSSALYLYNNGATFSAAATRSAASYTVGVKKGTSVGDYPLTLYAASGTAVDKDHNEASKSITAHVIDLKVTDAAKTDALTEPVTVDTKTGTDQLTVSGDSSKNFTYDYSLVNNSVNPADKKNDYISVDSTGKITAKKATTAKQTVYLHVYKGDTEVLVRPITVNVSGLPADTLTLKDKDGKTLGDVSNDIMKYSKFAKQYDGLTPAELQTAYAAYLDANKVGYIVLDATQVKSNKIVASGKSGAAITFADASESGYGKALTINSSTGEIKVTSNYDLTKDDNRVNYVKVTEAEKANTTRETSAYVYVFVSSKPLASMNVESTEYTIAEGQKKTIGVKSSTNAEDIHYTYASLDTYPTDDDTAVMISNVSSATTAVLTGVKAGKTVHVLATAEGGTTVTGGYTTQIITVNVIPAADAQIKSITNENTGKTVADKLTIDSATTLKLAIPSTSASISVNDASYSNNQSETIVNSVIDQDADTVKLVPNKEGTTTLNIYTNKENGVYNDLKTIVVTYKKVSVKKVTGVKVTNKKGAKVTVKWNKVKKAAGYTVRYKAGSGAWKTKTISSNKKTTTLKVKKGATIRVKVRAYKTRSDGKKVYGKYSTLKKLATDNK